MVVEKSGCVWGGGGGGASSLGTRERCIIMYQIFQRFFKIMSLKCTSFKIKIHIMLTELFKFSLHIHFHVAFALGVIANAKCLVEHRL